MEAFIEKGEEWLRPLLTFRNDLMHTFEQEFKKKHREFRRRTGRVDTFADKEGNLKLIWGPFSFEYRKHLLKELLSTQNEVQRLKDDQEIELIKKANSYGYANFGVQKRPIGLTRCLAYTKKSQERNLKSHVTTGPVWGKQNSQSSVRFAKNTTYHLG